MNNTDAVPVPATRQASPALAVGAGLAVCVALLCLRLVTSGDPFMHLAVGRWIAEHRAVPRANLFMYTAPGYPWADHSWLFELVLYWVQRLAGMVGVQVFVWFGVAGMVAVLLRLWLRLGAGPALAPLPFLLALVLMAERFRPRPELATMVLLALALSLLFQWRACGERSRTNRPGRAIWALPAMGVLWANLHGGMASGLLACALFAGAEGLRTLAARRFALPGALTPRQWGTLALATAAMAAAALVNPYGVAWYRAVAPERIGFLRDFIEEWRPLVVGGHVAASLPVLIAFLALLIGSFAASRRLDVAAIALVLAFGGLTLQSQRNLSLFCVVALAVMASNLRGMRWRAPWLEPAFAAAGALFGLAVIALALQLPPFSQMARMRRLGFGMDATVLPVRAEQWLREKRLPGRLFNEYRYGGYLVWANPEHRGRPLFIDGLNAYGADTFSQYLQIRRASPRAQQLLDRWQVNTCLLPDSTVTPLRQGGDLRVALADSLEWRLVYRDGVAVVFVRVSELGGTR